jgi:hypothetical protein
LKDELEKWEPDSIFVVRETTENATTSRDNLAALAIATAKCTVEVVK